MRSRFLFVKGVPMEFVVIARAIDSSNVPPQAVLALAKQTFQQFASNQDSRIKALYPFAGERAGVIIVDVKSGDELQELIGNWPLSGISQTEIHPIGTVQGVLKTLDAAERRMAAMAPAPAGTR
jgi:muconolactone delta-isomerase